MGEPIVAATRASSRCPRWKASNLPGTMMVSVFLGGDLVLKRSLGSGAVRWGAAVALQNLRGDRRGQLIVSR